MAYTEINGNLFNTKANTLVNTVNCVGAMGKGIALEFRRRFPEMFHLYREDCTAGKLVPGRIYPYPQPDGRLVLNFAIKGDWKQPSKLEWIDSTLRQFVAGYKQRGIQSAAFPWMGAMNGGLPFDEIQKLTRLYLQPLEDIDIEVYSFDPDSTDPLFERLKVIAKSNDPMIYLGQSGLQRKAFEAIITAVQSQQAISLARLIELHLVGETSIDKLYAFLTTINSTQSKDHSAGEGKQLSLF